MLLDNTIIQGKKSGEYLTAGGTMTHASQTHTQSPIFGVRESFFFHFFSSLSNSFPFHPVPSNSQSSGQATNQRLEEKTPFCSACCKSSGIPFSSLLMHEVSSNIVNWALPRSQIKALSHTGQRSAAELKHSIPDPVIRSLYGNERRYCEMRESWLPSRPKSIQSSRSDEKRSLPFTAGKRNIISLSLNRADTRTVRERVKAVLKFRCHLDSWFPFSQLVHPLSFVRFFLQLILLPRECWFISC